MLNRYKRIKDMMDLEREIEMLVRENGNPDKINDFRRKYVREIREELKRLDNIHKDPLEKPMTENWRRTIDEEYGESGKDFRILRVDDPYDWTDEEINEYIMSEVGYPPIYEPWDCTGKRFTAWTSWSRQPIGIVMIHCWGLDV